MVRICPKCGAKNSDNTFWCINCDTRLLEEPSFEPFKSEIRKDYKNQLKNESILQKQQQQSLNNTPSYEPHQSNNFNKIKIMVILFPLLIFILLFILSLSRGGAFSILLIPGFLGLMIGIASILYGIRSLEKGYTGLRGGVYSLFYEKALGTERFLRSAKTLAVVKKDTHPTLFKILVSFEFIAGIVTIFVVIYFVFFPVLYVSEPLDDETNPLQNDNSQINYGTPSIEMAAEIDKLIVTITIENISKTDIRWDNTTFQIKDSCKDCPNI